MIKEQPKQLFYDELDVKHAHNTGYWSGVLAAGTVALVFACGIAGFMFH